MTEITASERRLSAALDRIDQLLEAGTARPRGADPQELGRLTDERDALRDQIARLEENDDEAALSEAHARLATVTEESARLAAANEDLAAANRQLIEARDTGGIGPDEIREALEAEIEALRAARAAEIAQMGDIMAELERLLAEPQADHASTDEGV